MAITLYELAGADPDLRFSPYCWRTRWALAHKDIPVNGIPWRFTDKAALEFSGQGKVPVITDGAKTVSDSWAIAEYLEDRYPDHPPLFPNGPAHARFINAWVDGVVQPGIGRLIVSDVYEVLAPQDQPYFRETREKFFGKTLAEVTAGREERVIEWRRTLLPLRTILRSQPWIGGDSPDYADYILAGTLQWARCTSRFELLEPDDSAAEWFGRVLDLYDGVGRRATTV
jgi:glutathione S-transferase